MHYLLSIGLICLLIQNLHSQVAFENLCTTEVRAGGLVSIDGTDEFEIDIDEGSFLNDETIILSIKQKRTNYGINEFVLRAFDEDDNVIGRFDDQQIGNLAIQHHTCSNGASVIYVDKADKRSYREIPVTWRATNVPSTVNRIFFRADILSSGQIYRVKSAPLTRRLSYGQHTDTNDISVDIDRCGESQGCLIVPQHCNNNAKCEYALSWEVLDPNRVRFHIIARAHGFVGVGFSTDEKRGDDQVVLCTKDSLGHVFVRNTYVGGQAPQYISRDRPSYGIRNTFGYANSTHIVCKFERTLTTQSENVGENDGKARDGVDRNKLVNLKQPHYMYPVYIDQDLLTPQGMRVPAQDIPIVNNHPIDFQRRLLPKSHPRAASILAKFHAILNIIAWILLASAGLLVARYFDSIWPEYERRVVVDSNGVATGEKLQRRRRVSFFNVFQPILVTVAIMTWIAFFCILWELDWKWTSGGSNEIWHSILGVIVLVCAFLGPIVGVLRPTPRTVRYCLWYWIHWLITTLALCLAVPVVFLGMDNARLDLWSWCSWLLFGWCIFHFIVQLIFEIHACCYGRQDYERFEDASYYQEKHPDQRVRRERVPGETWKPTLLGIYMAITFIVVIVLIGAVILYQGY